MYISDVSIGISLPQLGVSLVESLALTGNMQESLLISGAVSLSNLVPNMDYLKQYNLSEKYVLEPIVAGIIYSAGSEMMAGKSDMLKNFVKGFIIGSSSAAVSQDVISVLYPTPVAQPRVITQRKISSTYKKVDGERDSSKPLLPNPLITRPNLVIS